jgi:DNA-binding response OmpR family regulator
MRVLVISGSSLTRALLVALLPADSFQVTATDSLTRALVLGPKGQCDVIVLHAEIPRVTADAVDRLHGALGTKVPVVLVDRAYSDERRASEEVRLFGANAFGSLPPDATAFAEILRGVLRSAPQAAAPGASGAPDGGDHGPSRSDAEQAARYIERLSAKIGDLDAYQVLRVPPDATDAQIQTAFRQRALEFHPDRQHAALDEETRERVYQIFKRVSRAFREVGDPAARRAYDAQRRDGR